MAKIMGASSKKCVKASSRKLKVRSKKRQLKERKPKHKGPIPKKKNAAVGAANSGSNKKPKPGQLDEDHSGADSDNDRHLSLLRSIKSLDGKKLAVQQRSEPAAKTSEYHNANSSKVDMGDMIKSLDELSSAADLKNRLRGLTRTGHKLSTPLEKIHAQKAEREIIYSENKAEVAKWQTIVEENRVVPHQQFPLQQSRMKMSSAKETAAAHQPRTQMELEIAALLKGPDHLARMEERKAQPMLTRAEERAQIAMNLAEAREKRNLLRQHRAMVADTIAKNHRTKKIKSRNYHRHLRLSRRKESMKELEKLKVTDAEAWKKKIEEIERQRVEERATLRHKGKTQFAREAKRYGQFNDQLRNALDEMHQKGSELTMKPPESESEESLEDDLDMSETDEFVVNDKISGSKNPWLSARLPDQMQKAQRTVKQSKTGLTAAQSVQLPVPEQLSKMISSSPDTAVVDKISSRDTGIRKGQRCQATDEEEAPLTIEITHRLKSKADVDRWDDQFGSHDETAEVRKQLVHPEPSNAPVHEEENIDPNKVIVIPSTDLSRAGIMPANDDSDEDHSQRMDIAQAFADDDVVEEFSRLRQSQQEREKKEEVLSVLPGWGHWGGAGIQDTSRRRRRRNQQPVVSAAPPAKLSKPHVIINQKALDSQPIAKYQVPHAPWPYTDSAQFRSEMSQPIGRDWVPMTAHRRIIQPSITTAVGAIITSLDKEMVQEELMQKELKSTADPGERLNKQYIQNKKAKHRKVSGKTIRCVSGTV